MFVIASGEVDVSVIGEGVARRLAMLGAGDIVGEMSLMTGARRSTAISAGSVVSRHAAAVAAVICFSRAAGLAATIAASRAGSSRMSERRNGEQSMTAARNAATGGFFGKFASPAAARSSAMRALVRAASATRRGFSASASERAEEDFGFRGAGIRSFQRQADRHHEARIAVAELDRAMVEAGDRGDKA